MNERQLPGTVRAVLILIGVNCICVVARVAVDFGTGEPQLGPSLPPTYYLVAAALGAALNLLAARLVTRGARAAPYLVMLLAAGNISAFIATLDLLSFVAAIVAAIAGALMWPRASIDYATTARAARENKRNSL